MADRTRATLRGIDCDRGSMSVESCWVTVGVMVFSAVAAASVLHFVLGVSLITVALIVGGIMIFLVAEAVALIVASRFKERTIAREREEWADDLRVWLGGEPPEDWHVLNWREARRRGLTVEAATRWAEAGFTPAVASAAARDNISIEQAERLADLMYSLGVCEPGNRRALEDVIGWHTELPSGATYPVLGRWLAFPLPAIRAKVGEQLVDSSHSWLAISPQHPAMMAAERALWAMEEEARRR